MGEKGKAYWKEKLRLWNQKLWICLIFRERNLKRKFSWTSKKCAFKILCCSRMISSIFFWCATFLLRCYCRMINPSFTCCGYYLPIVIGFFSTVYNLNSCVSSLEDPADGLWFCCYLQPLYPVKQLFTPRESQILTLNLTL